MTDISVLWTKEMNSTQINIRDPYILVYENQYYMYGTRGESCWGKGTGFDCYISKDLQEWSDPIEVFYAPKNFWAVKNFWAPEVHVYNGRFYMFASFKRDGICRGTQILVSDSPDGSFVPYSDGVVTPQKWECLDGTFYAEPTEGNRPYIVFCHEWVQVRDGEICCMPLLPNLRMTIGEPELLFHASEAPWIEPFRGDNYVTDGPFLHRKQDGTLLMLWSSFGKDGYTLAVATSQSGTVHGPWKQEPELLFSKDGGHGMCFTTLEGEVMVSLHSPNETLMERPCFYNMTKLLK